MKIEKDGKNLHEKKLSKTEKLAVREFLMGEPVCKVKSGVIKADQNGTAIENAKKWAEKHTQDIIRQDIGEVVEISNDLDKKPIKNVILVAPIQVDTEKSFLCVRLVKNVGNDNRLHIHEVFDFDDIKNTAIPFQTPGTDLTVRP